MTRKRRKDAVPAITVHQAFENLRHWIAEHDTGGDIDEGWARLRQAIETEEKEKSRGKTPARVRRRAVKSLRSKVSRTVRARRVLPSFETVVVCLAFVTSFSMFLLGGSWPVMSLPLLAAAGCMWLAQDQDRRKQELRERKRRQVLEEFKVKRRKAAMLDKQRKLEAAHRQTTPSQQQPRLPVCRNESDLNLAGADLRSVDLLGLNLIGACLPNTTMDGCGLRAANLFAANLSGANLFSADLSQAELTNADLTRAELAGAHLVGARLTGANLSWAHLPGANLSGAILARADLTGADLSSALLTGTDFSGADLYSADLDGAHLSNAHMHGANLDSATLRRANLRSAYLYRANLSHADLRDANLAGAVLTYAVLIDTDLSGAIISAVKDIRDVTWSERTRWGRYFSEVVERSVALGRGRFKLNPPDSPCRGAALRPSVSV
ncbi:pentapeptide repeat-containing protein [Nocardia sp. NPDC050408]|uniref:pentapeptide repeat-containing protein n=1 Tax=Nocardia sp. NPDC050408 TaxID=3364319 RepID=UPI0037A1CD0B